MAKVKKSSKEVLNRAMVNEMKGQLSKKNVKYEISPNEHGGFNIDIPELIVHDALFYESLKSVEDAASFIVNEMLVTEPDEIYTDSTQMLNPALINAMADWVMDTKLDDPDNYEEREKVYMSRNPREEALKIATRIVRAQMARKQILEIMETL